MFLKNMFSSVFSKLNKSCSFALSSRVKPILNSLLWILSKQSASLLRALPKTESILQVILVYTCQSSYTIFIPRTHCWFTFVSLLILPKRPLWPSTYSNWTYVTPSLAPTSATVMIPLNSSSISLYASSALILWSLVNVMAIVHLLLRIKTLIMITGSLNTPILFLICGNTTMVLKTALHRSSGILTSTMFSCRLSWETATEAFLHRT